MKKLRALWNKDPGLVVSSGVHALALILLLVGFARPQKFEDAVETVSVDMITSSELDEIMNGEKTAKLMPKPQRRVDKVAELEDHKPAPPLAEAKKDTPPPPAREKPNDDPGEDVKPPQPAAALPPPLPPPEPPATPTPPTPTPSVPTPPERPVEKVEAPKPPPKPAEVKPPPPPDAEALEPMPPPRPKIEPKKEAKHETKPTPAPHPRPVEKKIAKAVPPEPPKQPEPPPKPEPKKDMLEQVTKFLASMKPSKPVTKQVAGNDTPEAPSHSSFSLDKITALLDHDAPQRKASTGRQLTQMASLGAPNTHAEKMSPSMMGQLDNWLIDHYRGCWSYFGLGATQDYVPAVRVRMAEDGSLIGQPALLNPPSDPNLRSLADSAVRAVNRCNPMSIPDRFKPYYDAWRSRVVRFDPKEMS